MAEPTRTLVARLPSRKWADAILAAFVILVVGMMIVPLPTPLLDILITSNISVAVLMMLVALYVTSGLQLTAFPTILLVTTLYRLALNVSSTRLILLQADAGDVIHAFGHFVVRGNYVVGAVIFLILTLIQFVVIAKGSERVAEVGARFTLDAMPGKQMSIDAELRSGALSQDEARRRRRTLQRESEFYGAMDGAMKFVKGDAIAGIVITVVNILGGLAIGVGMRDMGAVEALETYGLLTIGDGLVSQIPALLISTAAGLVVTRVSSEQEDASLGTDVATQVFGNARAMAAASVFLVLLAIVPGLPALPFLVLAVVFFVASRRLAPRRSKRPEEREALVAEREAERETEARRVMIPLLVPVSVELAPDLAAELLEGEAGGPLLEVEVPAIRDELFLALGVALPGVRARAAPELAPGEFRVCIQEVPAAQGRIDVGKVEVSEALGEVAHHLATALRRRAHELLGLQETQSMLDQLERAYPALVRNVVPKPVSLALLADVLRRLVEEGVSVRPLREVLESLAVHTPSERDPVALTELVRAALRRQITHAHAVGGVLSAYLLDPSVEEAVRESIQRTPAGSFLAMPPDLARDVIGAVRRELDLGGGGPAILLTQADVRRFVRRLLEVEVPDATVLSYQELSPDVTVQPLGRIAP